MRAVGVVSVVLLAVMSLVLAEPAAGAGGSGKEPDQSLVVVIPVDYPGQIYGALVLAESLRTFGGSLAQAPVWIVIPEQLEAALAEKGKELEKLEVEVRSAEVPPEAFRYVLGAKPFTTAQAEKGAEGVDLLAIMAPNTIVLDSPEAFLLARGESLGYSTVHHQNVGSLASEPLDPFWGRLYGVLGIPSERVFLNDTLADKKTVRFYFNAGSFVVRPEAGLLQAWAGAFQKLYQDPEMAEMCQEGPLNTFLHQAALAGVALASLEEEDTVEIPVAYSYPLFFEKFHGGLLTFDSLEEVVTMRYEFQVKDLPEDWEKQVKASPEVLAWIRERLEPLGE